MNKAATHGRMLRVLMSLDAVGGVWRYAMDLAEALRTKNVAVVFAGFGPPPSHDQREEAEAIGKLIWFPAGLDWMAGSEAEVSIVPRLIADLAARENVDLVHLNLPSQAADLRIPLPVLVVSHSCVVTWFAAVRGTPVPPAWRWQYGLNRAGFDRADAVLAPSHSHALMLEEAYGPIANLQVVYNASTFENLPGPKRSFVFAAGRWWDEGKNGAVLDSAASAIRWPVVVAGACHGPNGQHIELRNVDYRGGLSHRRTMVLMRQAAIFVSPSVYEPFGLAPLEAARAGAALVLADTPIYRELWDGCALFANPADPGALADAVNRLIADADYRALLAVKAYERSNSFTSEAQVAAVKSIYDRLVRSNHALTAAE
jgi:glycosyltransferase involved in cell wall biosynthesis